MTKNLFATRVVKRLYFFKHLVTGSRKSTLFILMGSSFQKSKKDLSSPFVQDGLTGDARDLS